MPIRQLTWIAASCGLTKAGTHSKRTLGHTVTHVTQTHLSSSHKDTQETQTAIHILLHTQGHSHSQPQTHRHTQRLLTNTFLLHTTQSTLSHIHNAPVHNIHTDQGRSTKTQTFVH